MKNDIHFFKDKLQKEKTLVLEELKSIGVVKNTQNQDDWEARPADMDTLRADPNEVADRIESYENNNGMVNSLDQRLMEIDSALSKIENNTYGICEECSKEIEEARLEANPAAKTCIAHMK
ncbi:MAG: TraR/DksA C4-type zinc finger protein [Patescibacteria group bacterium]